MTHDNTQSDVVEELRAEADFSENGLGLTATLESRAADEIERLRAALTSSDAVLEERERCARIADRYREEAGGSQSYKRACEHIAEAIRKGDNA